MSIYCEICDIDLYNNLEYQNHLIGKRHVKNLNRKALEKRITEHSIFVSSIPKSISREKLIAFFQQYGPIVKYKFGAYYVIIEYNKREPVDYLLNKPVYIDKCKLDIKRRVLFSIPKKPNDNNSVEEVDPIDINVIKDKFENEPTFNSQLTLFLDTIQLTDSDIATRYNVVCTSLDNIFASVFPNSRTWKFGSTVTGLGFKECDLDIYMYIGAPIHYPDDGKQLMKNNKHFPKLWTMKEVFSRVKSIMYRMKDLFTNIRPILNAKTPIIKFCYIPTNISCDISFKNGFGVYNSLLLKHCLSYDVRIKPLIMLIKYCARQCKLTMCGKISNYALILMIIFYLQQPEQGILPPLMEFQKTCVPIYINGWQVNSEGNVTLPKCNNDSDLSNIPELLKGFFEFYINFNFVTNVICPLDGIMHKKEEFNEAKTLPSYMTPYKEVLNENVKLKVSSYVCIQDPIELNHNVAACMCKRLIDSFKIFCEMGLDVCTSSSKDNYKNLLKSLLQRTEDMKHNLPPLKQFTVVINAERYLNVALPDDFNTREDITDKNQYKKDNLFFTTFNIVKDIFEKVFMLEVEILSADNETKQQKIEVLSDVHTRGHRQLLLQCKGKSDVWFNRKTNKTILDPSMSALDKEALISSNIAKENVRKKGYKKMDLNFTCNFEREENSMKFQLTFNDMCEQRNVFKNFKHMAANKIPKITVKTLMHMLQFKKHY